MTNCDFRANITQMAEKTKKEEYKEKYFTTPNISIAAAILSASPDIHLVGFYPDENIGLKYLALEPRDLAVAIYGQYQKGELKVNARLNAEWVSKLKKLIFSD